MTIEETVEREEEASPTAADGEVDVVAHLRELEMQEQQLPDVWDADAAGVVETVEIIDDPEEIMTDLEIDHPEAHDLDRWDQVALEAARDADETLGQAVGAGGEWTVPPRVAVVEVALESGESFKEQFHLPRSGATGRLFELCDALEIVPEAGDSLTGEVVPVVRGSDAWQVTVPDVPMNATHRAEETEPEHEAEENNLPRLVAGGSVATLGLFISIVVGSPVPLIVSCVIGFLLVVVELNRS